MKYFGLIVGIIFGIIFGLFGMALVSPNAVAVGAGQSTVLLNAIFGANLPFFLPLLKFLFGSAGTVTGGNAAAGATFWIFLYLLGILVAYIIATLATGPFRPHFPQKVILVASERFIFGLLIGSCAMINAIFWIYAGGVASAFAISTPKYSWSLIFIILSLVSLLAIFQPVSTNVYFQTIIGWIGWVMPLTWFANLPGFIAFLIFILPSLGAGTARFNFVTASFQCAPNFGSPIPPATPTVPRFMQVSAIAMGHFTFIWGVPSSAAIAPFNVPSPSVHECGHSLTFSIFGGMFGWANLIMQIVMSTQRNNIPVASRFDYGELLAHSYFPMPRENYVPVWST